MPPKSKAKPSATPRAADGCEVRAKALARLQEADSDWWEGVEVNVPWAAAGAAYDQRADSWLGIITEVVEEADALDSSFTIEDPDDPDDAVVVTGAQLAGIEGFGEHDARIECAEIDEEVAAGTCRAPAAEAAPAAAPKRRGRPKGSKSRPKDGAAGARARAEAEADGIDPLGGLMDELDGDSPAARAAASKLKQGWQYVEYTDNLTNPNTQPTRIWGGIKHPRLRRRAYDAANGKLRAIETHDATVPPAAFEWMHRHLIAYALGDVHLGGSRAPYEWIKRTGQPAPSLAELLAWYATTKIMVLSRCSVLCEYWDRDSEAYNETIATTFSYHRWNAILSNLHFADRSTDFPVDESGTPLDKCPASESNWDIQGFQDLLVNAWCSAVDYTANLAMDEKAYRTKSRRVAGKQRNPAKPARYFMKGFAIAASDKPIRGYVFNVSMYGGAGDGCDYEDGAKVSYLMRCIRPDMHDDNLTLVFDNYYGGETPVLRLWERGIESVCTVNKKAVSHVCEPRDTGEVYKGGEKAGTTKLTAALRPGEFRTAVATIPDPRKAGETMQARAWPCQHTCTLATNSLRMDDRLRTM